MNQFLGRRWHTGSYKRPTVLYCLNLLVSTSGTLRCKIQRLGVCISEKEHHQYTVLSPLPISLMRPKFHERTSSKKRKRSWGRTKNLSGTTFLMNKAYSILSCYVFPIYAALRVVLCYSNDDSESN